MRKIKRISLVCVVIFIFLGCIILAKTSLVFANGGASGSGSTATGECSNTHTGEASCGRYGVSWRKYKTNDGGSGLAEARTACDNEDVDEYYVLAYERAKVKNGAFESYVGHQTLNPAVRVYQVRVPPNVSKFSDSGWGYVFANPFPNAGNPTQSWNEVKAYWDEAIEAGAAGSDSWTVDSWRDATWFCYDDSISASRYGEVYATSTVSTPRASGSKTSDEDGFLQVYAKTYEETFPVHFSHDLDYSSDIPKDHKNKYKKVDIAINWQVSTGDRTLETSNPSGHTWGGSDGFSAKKKKNHKTNISPSDQTVSLAVGETKTVCSTISYKNKYFEFNAKKLLSQTDWEWSAACVTVTREEKPEEPKDEFWATSSVQVPNASAQLGGYDPGKQTSDKDAAVGLKVSTDSDSLQFTLSHNMDFDWAKWDSNMWRYWNGCISTNADGSCNGDWVYVGSPTNLSYELTGDTGGVVENNNDEDATYKAGTDKDTDNGGEEVSTHTYTISGLEKGKTYKVCHKINYSPKTYTTPMWESLKWAGATTLWDTYFDHTLVFDHWNYGAPQAGNDSEDSEACIEITRPADPPEGGDPDPYGPKNGGDSASDIMYAGEHTNVSWNVTAKSVPTRRVIERKAVGFVVKSNVENASALAGTIGKRINSDPCTYFGNQLGGSDKLISYNGATCSDFNGSYEWTNYPAEYKEYPYNQVADIAVPDDVGGKYCNSYGYRWGYWWGVAKANTGNELTDNIASWVYISDKDYWTNYSATCRTIAKKPSFAVWNGSLFSGAGVSSSTAPRHNEANNGQPTKLNNDSEKTTYGSWAENIVAAQGEVSRFASSGAYGAGIPGLVSGNQWDMAWQTITNMGLVAGGNMLGNSGINYNSSYSTRLSAYLKSHATNTDQEAESYGGASGVGDTQILYFNPGGKNGTLTISGNVELANTSGKTIYEMPQVVIYVDGNVKIAPSVTRLDAWIIANGNVNTCSDWAEKTTETRSVYRNQNTTCDKRLQINGPVVAKSVTLNRTYGADNLAYGTSSFKNTSSEVFNLSALSYLWSFAQAGRYDSSYTDAYARELAPRY